MLDKDGYPDRESLKEIRKWDVLKKGVTDLIELIEDNWHFADAGYFKLKKRGKKFRLELHTAGWSGNEDVIEALKKSNFWWSFWKKSERGGHYYFEGYFVSKPRV